MSAIAGIIRFDGRPVDRGELERMANSLAAHGPDRRGIVTLGDVGLVHLLMRMTPEDTFDRQPLRGASGAIIAADLRLDNRDDIATELGIDRDRAMTFSDATLALAAWERWGDATWPRLRGPFAIAIWNPRDRVLTLARDQLGLAVLTWYRGADFLAFATLPKGLLVLPEVPRRLNEQNFADFVIGNHVEHETTFYRDIFRLPPAHVAHFDATGKTTTRRYWSEADIKPVRLESDQAYADALREVLDQAVRRQLRSIHPVGCFLSGGLDSSSITTLAARAFAEQGKRLAAYTQVPREGFEMPPDVAAYADETPYVEAIRETLGNIDVTYVRSDDCDGFAELERVFNAMDGPPRNPTNLGWMLEIVRRARTRNQRVLLGGDFGNLSVSWDGWAQAAGHLARGRIITAFRQWQLLYQLSSRSRFGAFGFLFLQWLGLEPRTVIQRIAAGDKEPWREYAALKPDFAAETAVEERARRVGYDFLGRAPLDTVQLRMQFLSGFDYRGDWHAALLSLYGVELRDPTSDLDVISFCLGIPDEQYLVEGIDRSLIRRAMWGLVPAVVLRKRQRGLQAADWFESLSRRRDQMLADVSELDRSPLARRAIDLERLRKNINDWPAGNAHKRRVIATYQVMLTRSLAAGRFLRWFERSN